MAKTDRPTPPVEWFMPKLWHKLNHLASTLKTISLATTPIRFSSKPVGTPELRSLLEAARWAASSSNEQPGRFIVAPRENEVEFQKLLSCLNESNQRWADPNLEFQL